MNKMTRLACPQRLCPLLTCLLLILWAPSTRSDPALLITVHDMLRQDAERAQQSLSLRSCSSQAVPGAASLPTAPGALELKAIYGRQSHLLAEVRHAEHSLVFQQGQPWPIGRHRDPRFRLHSISNRCIQLQEGERRHELCLEP